MPSGCTPEECGYKTVGTVWPIFYTSLIIATLIFFVLGYFVWKKTKPQTRCRHILLSGIIVLLLITYWTVGYFMGIFSSPQEYYISIFPEKKVPTKIKSAADQFIIRHVGKNEFEKNYTIDYLQTENCQSSRIGCLLIYEFIPGKRYGGTFYRLYYSYSNQTITIDNYFRKPPALLSCEQDNNSCAFTLSLADVQAITLRENLDERQLVFYQGKIIIELQRCKRLNGRTPRRILIDPSNGEKLLDENIQECIDIW